MIIPATLIGSLTFSLNKAIFRGFSKSLLIRQNYATNVRLLDKLIVYDKINIKENTKIPQDMTL